MSATIMLTQQVLIMFLLAGVGYVCFRTGKITTEGSKNIGNILIYLSLPCVIINGFLVERTPERLRGLLLSALIAAVLLAVSIAVSGIFFRKDAVACFASTFSNPGFFGLPLITASLSDGAVFYVAAFVAFLNLGQWTYGVSLLTAEANNTKTSTGLLTLLKKLIKAPFMVGILVGLFFFLTALPMPALAGKCIQYISNLNTPLAMFTVGIYLAQTDLAKMFQKAKLYLLSAVRLLLIPMLSVLVLCLVPEEHAELKMALLIAAACPVGSNVAVYAQLHNSDYAYAVETVIISTLLSVVTIPLIVQLAELLW